MEENWGVEAASFLLIIKESTSHFHLVKFKVVKELVREAVVVLFPLGWSVSSTEYIKIDRASGLKKTGGPGRNAKKMQFYPLASRAITEQSPK